jgi:serine/threonine protein phosphatase PrpC
LGPCCCGSAANDDDEFLALGSTVTTTTKNNVNSISAGTDILQMTNDKAISDRLIREGHGPGAAVCAAVWREKREKDGWLVMTVGDCKVMLASFRNSTWRIRWNSPIQSYANVGLTPPEGVSHDSPANMVGCGMHLPAEFHALKTHPGEILILCSDGFDSACKEVDLLGLLNKTTFPLNKNIASVWCEQAKLLGAHDDITVVLVQPEITIHKSRGLRWTLAILFSSLVIFLMWAWL